MDQHLATIWESISDALPEEIALQHGDVETSWRDFDQRAARFAAAMLAAGVRAGDTVFLSGLVSRKGSDNAFVAGDASAQTRVVLENAQALLNAANLTMADVVSARVYLTDAADFAHDEAERQVCITRQRREKQVGGQSQRTDAHEGKHSRCARRRHA